MAKQRPLHGEFLRQMLFAANGSKTQRQLSDQIDLDPSIISQLFTGRVKYEDFEDSLWRHTFKSSKKSVSLLDHRQQLLETINFLRCIEYQDHFNIETSMPAMAMEFLLDSLLIDSAGAPTSVFIERKRIQFSEADKEDDKSAMQEAVSDLNTESSSKEVKKKSVPLRTTIGRQPKNYIKSMCFMRPIKTVEYDDQQLSFHLNVSLGEDKEEFGNYVVKCGLTQLRIKSDFENIGEIHSCHRDGKLSGRLAEENKDGSYIVRQTCLGPPQPFLLDSIFNGEALFNTKVENSNFTASLTITCYVEISDFDFKVYSMNGFMLVNIILVAVFRPGSAQ